MSEGHWVADSSGETIMHLNGVWWYDAPAPRRRHRCQPQTKGIISSSGITVERCACGGTRLDGRAWIHRNDRRGRFNWARFLVWYYASLAVGESALAAWNLAPHRTLLGFFFVAMALYFAVMTGLEARRYRATRR